MYSHDEHRAALKRIMDVANTLAAQRDAIAAIRTDLHDDDAASTQDAREHLRAAAMLLVRAEKACDEAASALPTPLSRTDTAAAFRALHGGTA